MVEPEPPLFVYGTLRDPDLLAAVLGRDLGRLVILPATAPGFAAVHYPRRIYPGLARQAGAAARGLLLVGLSAFDRDLLDIYEGDEYVRTLVPVIVDEELHQAFAYLPTAVLPPGGSAWTLENWQLTHKPGVLGAERDSAAALRARLVAIRPN